MEEMLKGFNLAMLTDFYELTMSNGFIELGMENKIT